MTIKKIFSVLLVAAVVFVPFTISAQVTIGSGEPPRATLDVVASEGIHAGIIFPNVSLTLLNATVYTADQTGAVVHVYSIAGSVADGQTKNVTEPGLYYFDGEYWQSLASTVYTGAGVVRVNAETNVIDLHSSTQPHRVLAVDAAGTTPAFMQVGRRMLNTTPGSGIFPTNIGGHNDFIMPYHAGALPYTNLNNILYPGFYRIAVATTNGPRITGTGDNSATLQVLASEMSRFTQIMYHNSGNIYSRVMRNYLWSPWINLTANTTYTGSTSITITAENQIQRAALTGDVRAQENNNVTTVTGIQGRNVAARQPHANQALIWDGTAWVPSSLQPNMGWGLTEGTTWRSDFNQVLLITVYSNARTYIRRESTAVTVMQSIGSPNMVFLDDTWRALPPGMHIVVAGGSRVEVQNRRPVSINAVGTIRLLNYQPSWSSW